VVHLLIGRDDYHGRFDVSLRGVAASFGAAIIAIPFSGFIALVENAAARSTAGQLDPAEPYSLAYIAARWALLWLYFPALAAIVTLILARTAAFAPWVVARNWTHLFVVMIQLVPYALSAAGAPELAYPLWIGTIAVLVYGYVAVARAALGVGWPLAMGVGSADLACMLLIDDALLRAL
jgi:hypothetical protein